MKRIGHLLSMLWLALCIGLCLAGPAGAAGPPIITQAESQVSVLGDGGLDVKYRLTFRETEARAGITRMGRFDAGHQMLDYHIEHEGQQSPVTLESQGDGYYGVDFGFNTRPGVDYTLQVHYRVPAALDATRVGGEPYRVLEWSPIEWNLPMGEQIVRFILPVELPADVTQPEQVTDALVDQSGLKVDQASLSAFDRWVYYPTPDTASGKNWLSVYVSKADLPPQFNFRPKLYLPAGYFSGPAPGAVTPAPTRAAAAAPSAARPTPAWALVPFLLLFGAVGAGLAGSIVYVVFRRAAPKAEIGRAHV